MASYNSSADLYVRTPVNGMAARVSGASQDVVSVRGTAFRRGTVVSRAELNRLARKAGLSPADVDLALREGRAAGLKVGR